VNGYRATLPPIARDPLDDIREALCRFDAKQAGRSDITYADLSEEMADAPPPARTTAMEAASARGRPCVLLRDEGEQAGWRDRVRPRAGRLEMHLERVLEVIDSTVSPW